jgi:hypothetical protein
VARQIYGAGADQRTVPLVQRRFPVVTSSVPAAVVAAPEAGKAPVMS